MGDAFLCGAVTLKVMFFFPEEAVVFVEFVSDCFDCLFEVF